MRLGVLYSGGKDSTLALHRAAKLHEIACLITLRSTNDASYMFQTPNIHLTEFQAEALEIPLVTLPTKGVKEEELADLKEAMRVAKEKHGIEGVVTGAVCSTYQASRIQRICSELNLWCFNPLWLLDQVVLLEEVLKEGITAVISGVFAEGLEGCAGKIIDEPLVRSLKSIAKKHGINAAGEGGEIETTVLDAPLFRKRVEVERAKTVSKNHEENFMIESARLVAK